MIAYLFVSVHIKLMFCTLPQLRTFVCLATTYENTFTFALLYFQPLKNKRFDQQIEFVHSHTCISIQTLKTVALNGLGMEACQVVEC